MRNFFLLICSIFFMNSSLFSQKILPSNFFMTKLTNGLEVLVIEDNSVPLATIEIVVRNGAYTETPEYDGLSHLYEHMFFKANKDIPSQEGFMKRTQELGMAWNGTTSTERVNYFVTLSNQKIAEGIQFMNSAIRYPLFLEQEMKNENPVVDGEFQRAESNPLFFLLKDIEHKLWGEHYSRKNTIGDHDIILTATTAKMKTIQEKYYYPNNSMVVVAGDVKHKDVYAMVEKIMGDWKASDFDPFQKWPIPEFTPLKETTSLITLSPNAKLPIVLYALHGPDTRNDIPSTYAADVFSFILSQKTSGFSKRMIDSGLALQVSVNYQTCKFTGPIQVFLVPAPGKLKEAIMALDEEMKLWDRDDYFTNDQLETAKNLLAIQDAYGKEKTSEYVHTVTFWWASASIDYYTNYVDNLQKVTREDIKKYIQTYIKDKPMVKGVLLSPDMQTKMGINSFEAILTDQSK